MSCENGNHEYIITIIKKATDIEDGIKQFKCKICGHTYTEKIPSEGHEWGEWITDVEPSCIEAGHCYRLCKKDPNGLEKQEMILPATGKHNYMEYEVINANHEHGKIITYRCSMCGKSYQETVGEPLEVETTETETVIDEETQPVTEITETTKTTETTKHVIETTMPKSTEQLTEQEITTVNQINTEAITTVASGVNTMDVALAGTGFTMFWIFLIALIPYVKALLWLNRKKAANKKKIFMPINKDEPEAKNDNI